MVENSKRYAKGCTASCMNCKNLKNCKLKDIILSEIKCCDYAKEGCIYYKGKGKQMPPIERVKSTGKSYESWATRVFPDAKYPELLPYLYSRILEEYGECCLMQSKTYSNIEAKNIFCGYARMVCSDLIEVQKFYKRSEATMVNCARKGLKINNELTKEIKKYIKKHTKSKINLVV